MRSIIGVIKDVPIVPLLDCSKIHTYVVFLTPLAVANAIYCKFKDQSLVKGTLSSLLCNAKLSGVHI